MFGFPWGDFHSLNLGWFLQKFNELLQDWATAEAGIDGALDAEIQKAEDALTDVFAARDAAAASASAANSSAINASSSALNASQSSVASMNARDAARQAATNAAASETAAGNSATAAAASETAAGNSATAAAASETAAGNSAAAAAASETAAGQSATAAEESAQSVENEKLVSEGFATGEQNGVPVSEGPYYQNNAKYYASLLGNVRPSMGDVLLEEVMPTTPKSTTYSGRRVTTFGRRVSITRDAAGSTYRRHIISGESTATFSDTTDGSTFYEQGLFSAIRKITGASKIALNMWGDVGNTINTTCSVIVYTTGDGGTNIHATSINNTTVPFSPDNALSLQFTEEMIADLADANPEICIVIATRSSYESVRSTMSATLSLIIS